MRALLPLLLLPLLACPPARGDDDDSSGCGAGDDGTLRVCATYGGSPSAGSASVRPELSDDTPLDAILGADGCVEISLAPGAWEWRAAHDSDTCVSVFEQVDVESCAVADVAVELIDWCFDGR